MLKLSTLAATALILSAGMAVAQTSTGRMMPTGPTSAPGAADRAAPTNNTGSPTPNATRPMPQDQAQLPGMGSRSNMTTGDMDDPHKAVITDEYGNRYNSRGDRIGGRAMNR